MRLSFSFVSPSSFHRQQIPSRPSIRIGRADGEVAAACTPASGQAQRGGASVATGNGVHFEATSLLYFIPRRVRGNDALERVREGEKPRQSYRSSFTQGTYD